MDTLTLSIITIFIAATLAIFALLYLRPKALSSGHPTPYNNWKIIFFLALLAICLGVLLIIAEIQ